MVKRDLTSRTVVLAVLISLVVLTIVFVIYVVSTSLPKISSTLRSVVCEVEMETKNCKVEYTLKNEGSKEIMTNLNGTNGPGFAETRVSQLSAILDDGTSVPITNDGTKSENRLKPNQVVYIYDRFTIPKNRSVVKIKIIDQIHTVQ